MKTSSSAWFIYSLISDLTPTFDREPLFMERIPKTRNSAVVSLGVAETEEGVCDYTTDKIWHQQGAHDRI